VVQIYLTLNLFNSAYGQPINVGISVKPGRPALPQTKAIKKIAGTLKLELAHFLMKLAASSPVALRSRRHHAEQPGRGKRLRELLSSRNSARLILADRCCGLCRCQGLKSMMVPVELCSPVRA